MGEYGVMQVCLNGHQITDSFNKNPELRRNYCDKCGENTIASCPKCKTPIRGRYWTEGVIDLTETPIPGYCHDCGESYPWVKTRPEIKETARKEESDPLLMIKKICSRFHLVARQLGERHENRSTLRISDEYDVQDLLHALLKLYFDDIRPEEWTPSYAGGSSRMDFLLKREGIVIETKKTRNNLGATKIGEQLIIDIEKYKRHPDCRFLFCFVYDPEQMISNPRGLEKDLSEENKKLTVKVLITPIGY